MFRDLKQYKGRTILALIGIFMGIVSVGAVLSAYTILNREMKRNFMDTNPTSIIFNVVNLDAKAKQLLEQNFKDLEIEFGKTVTARLAKGNNAYGSIQLRAVEDFHNLKVDTFTLERGSFPKADSEMVLERDCLKILKNLSVGTGEQITVKLPGGLEKELKISGIVHAPGLAPASMENYSYGFLGLAGLRNLGYQGWYDEIRIVSYHNRFDYAEMRKLAQVIQQTLAKNGYSVSRIDLPEPGKHPHADQLNSLLFLLQAFTVIILLAACLIIINLLNFIISTQTNQIAIMKAVGARSKDIVFPYLGYVSLISLSAFLLNLPLSIAFGRSYSVFAAYILNFKIINYQIPFWVFVFQGLIGIIIPLTAAAYPIFKCCSKNVKEGLNDKAHSEVKADGAAIPRLPGVNSGIRIPFTNLLRKKTRTILAVCSLAVGGVLFMTSQNIVASIEKTVAESMKVFQWDYELRLAKNYPEEQLKKALNGIGGLNRYEIWNETTAFFRRPDQTDSPGYRVKIVPPGTKMVAFLTMETLRSDNKIIVNQALTATEKWIESDKKGEMVLGGKKVDLALAKIVTEIPPLPTVYMDLASYRKLFGGSTKQLILVNTKMRDISEQRKISAVIEERFKATGIELADNLNILIYRKAMVDHLYLIVTFLAVIALLAVIAGGLGIATAIGINISERKREIGMLRAVGANSHQVISMILLEVLFMGLASWLIGAVISYPISIWVGNYFGQMFLHTNLYNDFSGSGSFQWLIIAIVVSLVSGFIPARNVSTSSLRKMLAYE
jgi:putative ABC transport system permease protein